VPDVTDLLLEAPEPQRWPMLVLAAVHLETLRSGEPYPADGEALAAFCRAHAPALRATIGSHTTQTNEVGRCAYLLPCFAHAADGRPLALVEVGASAGLLLNWDRYRYDYGGGRSAGDHASGVTVVSELKAGDPPLSTPAVVWRAGIDVAPRPEDEWLRACVFADQPDRLARLDAALALAHAHPPRLLRGNAAELLPEVIAEAPPEAQVIVFHTAVAAFMDPEDAHRIQETAARATYVAAEYMGTGGAFTLVVDGKPVGAAQPHGRWVEWTA
jgi:hypothetical protein